MGKAKFVKVLLAVFMALVVSFSMIGTVYAAHSHSYKISYSKYCIKQHTVVKKCTKCGHKTTKREAHSYKNIGLGPSEKSGHFYNYKCSKCGQRKMTRYAHKMKNGKCTVCGYNPKARG